MRATQILGALLIAGGIYILIKSPTFATDKSVFEADNLKATVQQSHEIPAWTGGVALAAGLVLVVVGVRKR